MNNATRTRFNIAPRANVPLGYYSEFVRSMTGPRPASQTFIREDGVRFTLCASPTVYQDEEFNRYARPTIRAGRAE